MSGERINPKNIGSGEERLLYLRHAFVYDWCSRFINSQDACLDLGCGEGYGTKLLSKFCHKAIGIDVSKKVIAGALLEYKSNNCHFEVYNGKKIPFPDASFNVVIAFQVIEHVNDDVGFISEVYRVLKNDGIFILSTPNKLIRLPVGVSPWNIFHVREYNHLELEKLLKYKFGEIKLLGLTATEEAIKIEKQRISKNLKIISYDIFNLRTILPRCLTSFLVNILNFIRNFNRPNKTGDKNGFNENANVYKVEASIADNSLDILCVCKKIKS